MLRLEKLVHTAQGTPLKTKWDRQGKTTSAPHLKSHDRQSETKQNHLSPASRSHVLVLTHHMHPKQHTPSLLNPPLKVEASDFKTDVFAARGQFLATSTLPDNLAEAVESGLLFIPSWAPT